LKRKKKGKAMWPTILTDLAIGRKKGGGEKKKRKKIGGEGGGNVVYFVLCHSLLFLSHHVASDV